MKIRTQFLMTLLFFGVILAGISASAIITDRLVEKANEEQAIAGYVAQGASELSYLANDYIIYQESQQLERWQTRFDSFSSDMARLQADTPEQQALVSNIQANSRRLKDVFDSVVSGINSSSHNQGGTADPALLQVSWSRLAVQSQTLISDSSRLSKLLDSQANQLDKTNTLVVIALIGIFAAYLLVNYWMVQRQVLTNIADLQTGTAIIGSGNLDFKIVAQKNDEIGDLSRAFNRMTTSLKELTASKAELEREIEERKKAEAEISHLASFPELNPNPIIELDAAGNTKYANPAATTLFPDLMAKGSHHEYLAGWVTLAQTLISGETHSIARDIAVGESWYEQTATYLPAHEDFRVYGRDITARKQAEEALRETRDYLDNLFNYANAPIIVWDPGFEITRFNHAFERLTGRAANEVLGKKLDLLFPEDSREVSMEFIRKTAFSERWEVVEIPIQHIDGTVRILLWNSATLYAADGKTPVATIAQGQDISERKQAEEALQQSNTELAASNRELEAFSYSVSHDLRAPLRSMEGFSNALLEDYAGKLDDQGKKYLGYIQESSDLMARLIDDLLKLSRVTRSEINYEKVDLSELARSILAELQKTEPERKVKTNIAPGITAYGDRALLRLVLENLLGNAWKFSSKAGSPLIEMGTLEYNSKEAYFIRDNGVGFDMRYADKLFKPFQRLHKATEFAGTGIGLATVQRIVRRHGGEVWAESKVGAGATFYFTLS